MSITRLQQARQMYAMGKRVSRAFGGVMGMDGRRQYGGGSDAGKDGGYGYQGGGTNTAGVAGTGPASSGYGGGDTPSNDGPDNSPNIHTGPTYSPPTTNIVDEVALTGYGKVPGVDYSAVGPNSQFAKNTALNNQLLNTPFQGVNTPFMSLNLLGNTLGAIGHKKNTKFFSENSIGGKINPATGKPFGYGIDGYKAYMKQRALGNVGAYGGTELSQNAINARAGGGDGTQGIMDVYNNQDYGDEDGDGDVDQDDFIFKYFDETGETLQAGAGGVKDLMTSIRERISNLFS
jgi:hypothetical protein